jgi:hypothetical protein
MHPFGRIGHPLGGSDSFYRRKAACNKNAPHAVGRDFDSSYFYLILHQSEFCELATTGMVS